MKMQNGIHSYMLTRLVVLLLSVILLLAMFSSCFARPLARAEFNTNLITNPGFESGSGSWQLQPGGSVVVVTTLAHTGSNSLKLTNNGGTLSRYAYTFFPIRAGSVPNAAVWVNTDALDGADKTGAYLSIQYYGRSSEKIGIPYTTRGFTGVYDWTKLTASAPPAPTGTVRARLGLHLTGKCTGAAYFDGASVLVAAASKLRAVISYPSYRGTIFSGDDRKVGVAVSVTANPQQPTAEFVVDAQVLNGQSELVGQASVPLIYGGETASMEAAVSPSDPGSYKIVMELKSADDGAVVDTMELPFTIAPQDQDRPRVHIDSHNRCIVGGRPFFPLGMYTSGITDTGKAWLSKFRSMGFNSVVNYSLPGPTRVSTEPYMNEANRVGIKVLFSLTSFLDGSQSGVYESYAPGLESLQGAVNDFKSHPAVLSWYLNDEISDWFLPQLKTRYDWLKANDPEHPVYQVLYAGQPFDKHLDNTDTIGSDKYPNFGDSPDAYAQSPIWSVSTLTDSVQTAVMRTRPVWMVVSCASKYNATEFTPRPPTTQEILCMGYQAVIHGARGLFFFCAEWIDQDGESQWQAVGKAGQHLASLNDIFLGADTASSEAIVCGTPSVSTLTRRVGNRTYVLAVNPFESAADCVFQLPAGSSAKSVSVETPGTPIRLIAITEGQFLDTLETNGVRVYRLVF